MLFKVADLSQTVLLFLNILFTVNVLTVLCFPVNVIFMIYFLRFEVELFLGDNLDIYHAVLLVI